MIHARLLNTQKGCEFHVAEAAAAASFDIPHGGPGCISGWGGSLRPKVMRRDPRGTRKASWDGEEGTESKSSKDKTRNLQKVCHLHRKKEGEWGRGSPG